MYTFDATMASKSDITVTTVQVLRRLFLAMYTSIGV
jgi:hypothetical protein